MSDNFKINKDKIINDYYKCIGTFKNCEMLYKNKNDFTITENDNEEEREIKKGRTDDLLSNLGKVGEKAFKYIFALEILNLYPNIDTNSFETFFRKENPLKDFALKHGIDKNDKELTNILDYKDANNQKSHNFDYWFSIINLTMKDTINKFKKYIEYVSQSKILIDYCEKENEYNYYYDYYKEYFVPFLASIFPDIDLRGFDDFPHLTEKQLNKITTTKREVIKKSGDIFTRFRYASNNPDKKVFSLDEIYDIINDLTSFIEIIHQNNDNLNFDLNRIYSKRKMIEYKEKFDMTEEEIKNLYSLDLENIDIEIAITNGYNYNSIKNILSLGIEKNDLLDIMHEGLNARNILYFKSIGITDYKKMRDLLNEYIDDGIEINKKIYQK